MEFLRTIFGDKPLTFDEFTQAINAHNGNEANKGNQIKIGNLGGGEYVGKGKYEALEALLSGKENELTSANALIEELKKGTKGDAELQGKISNYETVVVPQLQAQLQEVKINSALKIGLLAENCKDIDYVTYKIIENLKADGKTLELDENENIKNWADILSGAKTQLPTQFGTGTNGRKVLGDNRLPTGDNDPVTVTREQFAAMGYNERLKLKQENEALFKKFTN